MGINLETAMDVFVEADNILDAGGRAFPHSVYAGQLLSMYRQNEIVPHPDDSDLDFAVLLPKGENQCALWRQVTRDIFHEAGFTDGPKHFFTLDGFDWPCQECFVKDGNLVDIITYFPAEDGVSMFNLNAAGRKVHPIRLFHDRQQFFFKGHYFPMLWPAVEYCKLNWGEDWILPKKSKGPWPDETLSLQRDVFEWM